MKDKLIAPVKIPMDYKSLKAMFDVRGKEIMEYEELIAELFHWLDRLDDGSPEVKKVLRAARKMGFGESA